MEEFQVVLTIEFDGANRLVLNLLPMRNTVVQLAKVVQKSGQIGLATLVRSVLISKSSSTEDKRLVNKTAINPKDGLTKYKYFFHPQS